MRTPSTWVNRMASKTREPPTTWIERNGPWLAKYGVTAFSSAVPWYVRVWFAVSNPFTYVLFGYVRW